MEKTYNFVFITTNLVNSKQYVGDHSTNDMNCFTTKNYIGSGKPYFYNAKKKYRKKSFKREILEFFPTKQEAFDAQEKYIIQYNTLSPNGYNISPTGGLCVRGCHSKETIEKLRKPKSEEHKKKISISLTGKIGTNKNKKFNKDWCKHISEGQRGLQAGEKHPMFGKHHKDLSIQKMKDSKKGKILNQHIKGIKRKTKKCEYCNMECVVSNYNRWHGENCKFKIQL